MLRHDLLQATVLLLQGFQPLEITDRESGVLGLPVVVGCIADSVPAAEIGDPGPGLPLPEHRDDLFLGML